MKKFKFTLESLMSLRKFQKDEALQGYAECVKVRAEMERDILDVKNQIEDVCASVTSLRGGAFPASDQDRYNKALASFRLKLEHLEQGLQAHRVEEAEKLKEFYLAKQKEDILIRLKEKRHKKYIEDQIQFEEKMIGDIINAKYAKVIIQKL